MRKLERLVSSRADEALFASQESELAQSELRQLESAILNLNSQLDEARDDLRASQRQLMSTQEELDDIDTTAGSGEIAALSTQIAALENAVAEDEATIASEIDRERAATLALPTVAARLQALEETPADDASLPLREQCQQLDAELQVRCSVLLFLLAVCYYCGVSDGGRRNRSSD
jgi:hypothetical protein